MEHLLVLTDDVDETRAFWCDALGLEPGDRPPLEFPGIWLYAGGVPCVHVADRAAYVAHARSIGLPAAAEAGGPGPIDHVAFAASDHAAVVARLERRGVPAVHNTVPGAGIRQVFVRDPNGVVVEINVKP